MIMIVGEKRSTINWPAANRSLDYVDDEDEDEDGKMREENVSVTWTRKERWRWKMKIILNL